MESRIAKLEATVEHILESSRELRGDSKEVRDRLSKLEVKVDHLPSKGFIVIVVSGAAALLVAFSEFKAFVDAAGP